MPVAASRVVLRQSYRLFRGSGFRHASSTSEAGSTAKEAASSATSKAPQGLSRVTSSAGPVVTATMQNVGNALRRIGGRTGKVVAFVDSLIPPTIYYTKVGFELAKMVVQGQKMAPPSFATFQAYFQPIIDVLRQPSTLKNFFVSPQAILLRLFSLNKRELVYTGVAAAEVIGFFAVGEMIGRRKIVGYRGAHEH